MKKYFVYNEVSCISSHGFNTRVEAEQEYAKHHDKYKSAAKIVDVDMKDEEQAMMKDEFTKLFNEED